MFSNVKSFLIGNFPASMLRADFFDWRIRYELCRKALAWPSRDLKRLNDLSEKIRDHEKRLIAQDRKMTIFAHDTAEMATHVIQLNRIISEMRQQSQK